MTGKSTRKIEGVDTDLLVKDATALMSISSRRSFLKGTGSLGSLMLLTGCSVVDGPSAESLLKTVSRFNDWVQGRLFDPKQLARTYQESEITRPFRFNAFYPLDDAPEIDGSDWQLTLAGRIKRKSPWTLERLNTLPKQTQITNLICVEGWNAIGKWSGPCLGNFLKRIGADTSAKYVGFLCDDRYLSSMDMATALHPQTQISLMFDDKVLPRAFGFPMRIRVPTKLGFKNPKYVNELFVTNDYPGGFWEDRGYNWFSGL